MVISTDEKPDIEEILNGPDYFLCEKFNVRMPMRACVQRQEGKHVVHSPYMETMTVKMSMEECKGCEQGRKTQQEVSSMEYAEKDKTTEIKKKICKECEKMKPLDEFYRHAYNKDEREGICKRCKSERAITSYKDKKKREEEEKILTLDLSDFPEILDGLKQAAKKNFREIEMQAIAYIYEGVANDGYYGKHNESDQ